MSIVDDIISFITNVLVGGKAASKAFMESLTMAERYTNWGQERNDLRDYLSALSYIEKCDDQNAPKEETIVIKYCCLCDTLSGASTVLAAEYNDKKVEIEQKTTTTQAEENNLTKNIQASQNLIAKLKSDGSLIKARDEQQRLDDLTHRHSFLVGSLASGDALASDIENYETVASQIEEFCVRAEAIIQTLLTAEGLSDETRATVQHQITDEVERSRQRISILSPGTSTAVADPADASEAAPPPGEPAEPSESPTPSE